MPKDTSYSGEDIQVLEGLEAVARRPGMYIGNNASGGLSHLTTEIIANSVDEAIAGYCSRIEITFHEDGSVEVEDNGRGIPVDTQKQTGLSALEVIFTVLHAGGKFGGKGYAAAGGLHGVGASVVNALSNRVQAIVYRDGKKYEMNFHKGIPGIYDKKGNFTKKSGVQTVGAAPKNHTGTKVRFWPNMDLFTPDAKTDVEMLTRSAQRTAFLVPNLALQVRDLRDPKNPKEELFKYSGGVKDMVEFYNHGKSLCDPVHLTGSGTYMEKIPMADEKGHMRITEVERTVNIDIAFQWNTGYEENIHTFVNVVSTPHGGTHQEGFKRGLLTALRKGYDGTRIMKQNEDPVTWDDVTEGLTAVISVSLPEPQFVGQTKEELGTPGVTKAVQEVTAQGVKAWLEGRKKTQARQVLEKVANAARTRVSSRTQREAARRKTALEGASMPPKLVDCRTTGVERSEIFIVEGDSALGCWFSSTMIATVGGKPLSIKALAEDWENGKTHFGYASDENGDIVVVPLLEPRLTKKNAPLVMVTLDNGEELKCTPDHLFRLRDGSYKRADQLVEGESLMPLYRRFSDKKNKELNGYEMVQNNSTQKWVYTHHIADEHNLLTGYYGENVRGYVRHHVDFNKLNNDPRNLQRVNHTEHMTIHGQNLDTNKERIEAGYRKWLEDGGRAQQSAQLKSQWEDPEFREMCLNRLAELNADPEFRARLEAGFQEWYAALSDEEKAEYAETMRAKQEAYWSDPVNRAVQSERVRQYFIDHPEHRENHREMGLAVWEDEELLAWRSEKTVEQFSDPAERERQRQAVVSWHEEHPEFGMEHSARMKTHWASETGERIRESVKAGRARYLASTTTQDRAAKINAGKLRKAVALLRSIDGFESMSEEELRSSYDALRKEVAPTGFGHKRLWSEFEDSHEAVVDAALNYNHKVVSVTSLAETGDVYDITVDHYHNFALEAGIFVHNSARSARNSEYQALLPIRGKILNVQKASLSQILANAECTSIIQVVGAGSGRTFDLEQMRYNKVIIMADADVDGAHIRSLLIVLACKLFRPMVEAGRLYTAVPPLFKIETTGRNKETIYAYSKEEMEQILVKLEKAGKTVKTPVSRFKGLGEMNAEELWDTTLNPEVRTLRQITMGDMEEALASLELVMGDKVEPRRDWIIRNADKLSIEDLDL